LKLASLQILSIWKNTYSDSLGEKYRGNLKMPAKAKGFKSDTNHSCLGSCRLWFFSYKNVPNYPEKKISGSLLATWVVKKNIRLEKVKQTHFRIQWCHKSNQSSKISKENQIKPMYINTQA